MALMFQKLFAKLNIDGAIIWSVAGFAVSAISGFGVAYFIARFFTPELQGYYYTFAQMLALSVFLELGFSTCIIQFASHEFAHLRWSGKGRIEGPVQHLHRFISLARLSLKWYTIGAMLLFIGLGFAGEFFFQRHQTNSVSWRGAWWLLCGSTSAGFPLLALTSLLTGCNEVEWTAKARLYQSIVRTTVLIVALMTGLELYSMGAAAMMGVIVLGGLVCSRWRILCKLSFQRNILTENISWKNEIWPFQWRIALSWASGYFIFSTFNPILFEFEGAVLAGQFGLTWAIIQSCGSVAQVFTNVRQPKFGSLIALQEWRKLRKLWLISVFQTTGVFLLMVFSFLLILKGIHQYYPACSERFLSWKVIWPLLGATFFNQIIFSIATLLRAEKKEPFLLPSLISGILVFTGGFLLGTKFGVSGIIWNYFSVMILSFFWSFFILLKAKCLQK
jgi:hypothetical protein